MITTFERLAKVLKGEATAANWIESAFAALASAVNSIPAVTNSDRGKFLGVNLSNNNLGWKAIRQVPDVENADKGKYLHANDETGAIEWAEASGVPDYTYADINKVLGVIDSGDTQSVTTSCITQQNVALEVGEGLQGTLAAGSWRFGIDMPIKGDVYITIDNETYTATASQGYPAGVFLSVGSIGLIIDGNNGSIKMDGDTATTITISAVWVRNEAVPTIGWVR